MTKQLSEEELDFDYLGLGGDVIGSKLKADDASDPVKVKKKGGGGTDRDEYILGTLIVRVVAARKLQPAVHGGGLQQFVGGRKSGTANPRAKILFCNQMQWTSEAYETLSPIWPRGEQSYFDVQLPLSSILLQHKLQQVEEGQGYTPSWAFPGGSVPPRPQQPLLTVVLSHAFMEPASEFFLGMATVDLGKLFTGVVDTFDEWIPLEGPGHGAASDVTGAIRIACEYEPTDPPPQPGDICVFTGFCNPLDLYPLPPYGSFTVVDSDNNLSEADSIVLRYLSPEGWPCTFRAHRFMLLCCAREGAPVLHQYTDKIGRIAHRLAHSELVHSLKETVDRVPDDGLVFIGLDFASEGMGTLGRWFQGGIGAAVEDVVHATNLDGLHPAGHKPGSEESTPGPVDEGGVSAQGSKKVALASSESVATDSSDLATVPSNDNLPDPDGEIEGLENLPPSLPGMPCCPITGQKMRVPVVAADGHTYERTAIERWLQSSDRSPLTGERLPHKELVPNYLLLSTVEEDRKMPPDPSKNSSLDTGCDV